MARGSKEDLPRFLVTAAVTFVFLGAGLWIISGDSSQDAKNVAYVWLGGILGYWLS